MNHFKPLCKYNCCLLQIIYKVLLSLNNKTAPSSVFAISVKITSHLHMPLHTICIFLLHRAVDKIHTWKLCACGKIFAYAKVKSRKDFLDKKKGPKKKEEYHSITPLYAGVQISNKQFKSPSNQNLFIKVPTLIQKQLPRIVILKAVCRFVVVLLSTLSGFSIFTAGLPFEGYENIYFYSWTPRT